MATKEEKQPAWQSELFSLLIETSKDYAVFIIGLDGNVLTWNHGAERVFGYTEDEIVGQPSSIFFTPEDRAKGIPQEEMTLAYKDGRASDDRWHIKKGNTYLWVSGVMSLVRDENGNPRAYAKVMRDFTEAKLAADTLRESEGRLRVALDAADMGTWLWRIQTDEQILDDSLRRLMGLSPGEGIKTLDGFLRAVHVDDRDRVLAEFERCRRNGGEFNVEFRVHRTESGERWLKDQGKAFAAEDGRIAFITGACVDITARKRNEEALLDADRRKDEFLALLAHELRNPLAPIRNGLQVMRLAKHDAEAVSKARAMMDRQLAHMVRLIDDLLDISRLSQNKLNLQRSRVLLSDVVAVAVETAKPMIDAARHDLTISLPPDPIYVDADLTRLSQVLSNLLTNSAKYTEPKGQIWLRAERSKSEVVVTVRDTGIGIPSSSLPYIFDMFSQIDRSIERSSGGLGIGLALVKGLVEMHGGSITASSDGQGHGSLFTVTLPILTAVDEIGISTADDESTKTESKLRFLVVDDNRDSAESMTMMLELLGHEVFIAHDGIAGVEEAERIHPAVVLMDVGMPRLNGLEATKRIRERDWGRKITVIAMTGFGQEADQERSRAAGCDGHLVKPVDVQKLKKLLANVSM